MKAIEYEANRQVKCLESGNNILQETRLFDTNTGRTKTMRSKEEAHDYRYFPDPDLLPLELTDKRIEDIRKTLPELPDDLKTRLIDQYGLGTYDARVISSDQDTAEYFEILSNDRDAKQAANWIITNLFGKLNDIGKNIKDSPIDAKELGKLLDLINKQIISNKIAKEVFEEMFVSGETAENIIEEKGLKQISNTDEIEGIVDKIISFNENQKIQYQSGNSKVLGWFVGQVMKLSDGKANPQLTNEILKKLLKG